MDPCVTPSHRQTAELIVLAEVDRWVGADFEVDSAEDGRVKA